jgi:hypothetical protein
MLLKKGERRRECPGRRSGLPLSGDFVEIVPFLAIKA